jgi:hypothetical protein
MKYPVQVFYIKFYVKKFSKMHFLKNCNFFAQAYLNVQDIFLCDHKDSIINFDYT